MRIIGIDPGINITGYGLIEASKVDNIRLIESGVVRGGDASGPLEKRLLNIYVHIEDLIKQYSPQVMAMEQLYSHYKHPLTAVQMGHARGVICLAAARSSIPVFGYPSTQVKQCLTGSGSASKEQIQRVIMARLSLPEIPQPADVSDALAVAICHCMVMGSPVFQINSVRA